jgi:hypothetical protein
MTAKTPEMRTKVTKRSMRKEKPTRGSKKGLRTNHKTMEIRSKRNLPIGTLMIGI